MIPSMKKGRCVVHFLLVVIYTLTLFANECRVKVWALAALLLVMMFKNYADSALAYFLVTVHSHSRVFYKLEACILRKEIVSSL